MSETQEQKASAVEEPRVIAIGDYVKELDKIVKFPVMHEGKKAFVEVRIMKPMADYSQKTMELLSGTFGEKLEELSKHGEIENILDLPQDERKDLILFSWLTSATLVSSCCYHPDRDVNGNPVPKEQARIIWKDESEVGMGCPNDLWEPIKKHLEGLELDATVTDIEAKK